LKLNFFSAKDFLANIINKFDDLSFTGKESIAIESAIKATEREIFMKEIDDNIERLL